jgi:hypothetical protein
VVKSVEFVSDNVVYNAKRLLVCYHYTECVDPSGG